MKFLIERKVQKMTEMTPQKALEILELFLDKQCNLQRTELAYSQNEVWKAVKIANDALEKQLQETTGQGKTLTLVFGKDGKARLLNEDYVIYCADKETFEKVKKAVEKQIPKKPKKEILVDDEKRKGDVRVATKEDVLTENNHSIINHCPNCNEWVTVQKYLSPPKYDLYCRNCGQALDWSDTE